MDRNWISQMLENIGAALMDALEFKTHPVNNVRQAVQYIDEIMSDNESLQVLEEHLASHGGNYVLFYISNVLYNLKTRKKIELTAEVLRWLSSVWKNFLNRNIIYQERFELIDNNRILFQNYFPRDSTIVTQIDNVHRLKDDFIDEEGENSALKKVEGFYWSISELRSWMKPTYYFMLDFHHERNIHTGKPGTEGAILEKEGLAGFGYPGYTYWDLTILGTQALALLEAVYLILKKSNTSKKVVMIEGKQKFLTNQEIYSIYRDRFSDMKKELTSLKQ